MQSVLNAYHAIEALPSDMNAADTRARILEHRVVALDSQFVMFAAILDVVERDQTLTHGQLKGMALNTLSSEITIHGGGFSRMTNAQLARELLLPVDADVSPVVAGRLNETEVELRRADKHVKRAQREEKVAEEKYHTALEAYDQAKENVKEAMTESVRAAERKMQADSFEHSRQLAATILAMSKRT